MVDIVVDPCTVLEEEEEEDGTEDRWRLTESHTQTVLPRPSVHSQTYTAGRVERYIQIEIYRVSPQKRGFRFKALI